MELNNQKPISKKLYLQLAGLSLAVFPAYVSTGMAFGLLALHQGFPWWLGPLMSLFVYAGAAQFVALGLLSAGAGLWELSLSIFLVNLRHLMYGLNFLKRYRIPGPGRYYLIGSLTDETYVLLSAPRVKALRDEKGAVVDVVLSLLHQSYWLGGTVLGTLAGSLLARSSADLTSGLEFSLTALFAVLLIEQLKGLKEKHPRRWLYPLFPGFLGVIVALVLFPGQALLAAFGLALFLLWLGDLISRGRHVW